jgi:signal transduction histidine kinase
MIQTIFRNLISNAIKFSKPGGLIVLDATFDKSTNKTLITITDHGVGITEENRSKLFDIKTHQSTKGTMQESGTGLGLLICKEFIEKHGGNIHVNSTIGEGTQIIFDLPSFRE